MYDLSLFKFAFVWHNYFHNCSSYIYEYEDVVIYILGLLSVHLASAFFSYKIYLMNLP